MRCAREHREQPPSACRRPVAAAGPSAAAEARLSAGEGLASAAGARRGGVKNSVYALPAQREAQEDFEWLLREIVEGGGEAMICEARLIDGLTDEEVRTLFDASARRRLSEIVRRRPARSPRLDAQGATTSSGARCASQPCQGCGRVVGPGSTAIDFFGAERPRDRRGTAGGLEARLQDGQPGRKTMARSSKSSEGPGGPQERPG